ncbi:GntR family transcriptional regulator [Priestia filamentosa]|uniref:GntR family transcriptional regulator n=1 Tax=Priestia filamentosa TaxID=1402861 RepID=UPI000E742AC5|nr:GntR family transcriptional regulator [Priestia filamentosa]RJS62921.1 GntR family transcriptional regulator [Priestia filamentosa]
MIKDSKDVPFYKQLKSYFIEQIENGDLTSGDKIPSERELAEIFNISRMTARHAVSLLEREGFVERIVGSGTFISNKRFEIDFITFDSFTNSLLNKGLTPTTKMLSVNKQKPKALIAKALGISSDEDIIFIKRLRLADGIPISVQSSHIPYKYCQGIEEFLEDNVSLYNILEQHYDIKLVKTQQYMRVLLTNEEESKLLRIGNESPCIFLEETTSDSLGRIVDFSKITTRSDIINYYSEIKR